MRDQLDGLQVLCSCRALHHFQFPSNFTPNDILLQRCRCGRVVTVRVSWPGFMAPLKLTIEID